MSEQTIKYRVVGIERSVSRWMTRKGEGEHLFTLNADYLNFETDDLQKLIEHLKVNGITEPQDAADPETSGLYRADIIEDADGRPDEKGEYIALLFFRLEILLVNPLSLLTTA